jgi:hypothetical protein
MCLNRKGASRSKKSAIAAGFKGLAVTGGAPWRDDVKHPPEIVQIPDPSIGVGRQPVAKQNWSFGSGVAQYAS